jgi:hypothetical protein
MTDSCEIEVPVPDLIPPSLKNGSSLEPAMPTARCQWYWYDIEL